MAALLSQRRDNNDKPRKIYDILRRTIKRAKQLSGRQLSDLFDKYRVWNYLYDCYEALHTTGTSYIIEDIDLYIDARKPVTVYVIKYGGGIGQRSNASSLRITKISTQIPHYFFTIIKQSKHHISQKSVFPYQLSLY